MAAEQTSSSEGIVLLVQQLSGRWQISEWPTALSSDLNRMVQMLRAEPDEAVSLLLLGIDDDYTVVMRKQPGGTVRLALSDATAAADDSEAADLAADVLEMLGEAVPEPDEIDDDESWPVGSFELLSDLGMAPDELESVLGDIDLYPDEMMQSIAEALGFSKQLSKAMATSRR